MGIKMRHFNRLLGKSFSQAVLSCQNRLNLGIGLHRDFQKSGRELRKKKTRSHIQALFPLNAQHLDRSQVMEFPLHTCGIMGKSQNLQKTWVL